MLRKTTKAHDNVSQTVNMILQGAKKRRSYAIAAVKTLNSDMGVGAKITLVK